jgi:predicted SnoaL-like aldol condensation-catalyzing enzyme
MSAQTYIQHNPLFCNGKQAFIDYFDEMARDYPDKSINFDCAVAESDLVALHPHQIWPGNDEYVTMDFFHFNENGKIIEHKNALQTMPNETKNGNTIY